MTSQQNFQQYWESKKVLVADESSSCRTSIARTLIEMGAKTTQIELAGSHSEAMSIIESDRPQVIVSDYFLGKQFGLDLVPKQKQQYPDNRNTLFVLVTTNASQSAVAEAAEEDVDSYILKPFTSETLRFYLLRAVQAKVQPTEYRLAIESGKTQLEIKSFDEALSTFRKAKVLAPAPSLACYYEAKTGIHLKRLEDADRAYEEGLRHNEIHYRCLSGRADLLILQEKKEDAYQVVRKMVQNFPISTQRLGSILRLAVETENYNDIDYYFEIYQNIDQRPDYLVKTVSAALVVCGLHHVQSRQIPEALEIFKKAVAASGRKSRVIREIIVYLCEHRLFEEAETFISFFEPGPENEADRVLSEFLVLDGFGDLSTVIERGRDLLKKGFHNELIYAVLLRRSHQAGFREAAEKLYREALQLWPEKKDYFSQWNQS